MENLINELENYLTLLNVEQLYNDPGHRDSKNWIAGVSSLLKTNRKFAYKRFMELSQHLVPSVPLPTRKHAVEQLDVFIRQILAQYKREFVTNEKQSEQFDHQQNIDKIRIFLSYSSLNKVGAGKIKSFLSDFGFEVFLAHEDIEPSLEWQKEIIKHLKECHIFIPLITKQFYGSKWTDQESGMAFITDKLILPIIVGENLTPRGFLGMVQGMHVNPAELEKSFIKIIKTIHNDSRFTSVTTDLLIKALIWEKSPTFRAAEWKTTILANTDRFSRNQFNELLKVAIENGQVRYAKGSREDLNNLIKKFPKLVSTQLLEKLNNDTSDFKFGV